MNQTNRNDSQKIGQSAKNTPIFPGFLEMTGLIKTVNIIPVYKPTRIGQQLRLYVDNYTTPTVARLYIYSHEAQKWTYLNLTLV